VTIVQTLINALNVLAWPIVALLIGYWYRDVFRSLFPGAKVKLTISGVAIETSIPVIEQSVTESLRGRKLTPEQWSLLKKLHDDGRTELQKLQTEVSTLRPLRDSGLVRGHPEGFLANATEIEITTLGRLLVEASEHG
jgi:hypothetical protein